MLLFGNNLTSIKINKPHFLLGSIVICVVYIVISYIIDPLFMFH